MDDLSSEGGGGREEGGSAGGLGGREGGKEAGREAEKKNEINADFFFSSNIPEAAAHIKNH